MSKQLAKSVKCRYLVRTNTIKSSNFEMNLDSLKAYSYNWWLFCTKVNGLVIFNNSTYSMSTCKHQSKAFKVLDYQTDLVLRYTTTTLANLELALDNEIKGAKLEIKSLLDAIKRPRTHKARNLERKQEISQLLKHISQVRSTKKAVL